MLPDRSLLIGQKLVENAKIEKLKCDNFGDFQTLCTRLINAVCILTHLMLGNTSSSFSPNTKLTLWNKVTIFVPKYRTRHFVCILDIRHNVWKSLKMSHLIFLILAFSTNFFVLLELTCLVTLFNQKFQVFKKSPSSPIFGIFNELLSTQNANVARFARNVECDFFCDF